jgi:hypothetical protein
MYIGDDWAEDHHDVEIEGEDGRRLTRARLPVSVAMRKSPHVAKSMSPRVAK